MSRNSFDRLSQPDMGMAPPAAMQGGGIVLSTPTEFVELPSQGLLYPPGHPLHGKKEIEIKFMTAREEDILTSQSLIEKGVVLDRLIQSIIINKEIDSQSILMCDRNAIFIAARTSGYGPDYNFVYGCPVCETKNECSYDLEKKQIIHAKPKEAGCTISGRGTYVVELPKTKASVEFKIMTGYDESVISGEASKQSQAGITDLLKRLVVSVNGVEDIFQVRSFIDNLPAYDSRFLRNLVGQVTPKIEMVHDFTCKRCGHSEGLEVPVTLTFFWPDAKVR